MMRPAPAICAALIVARPMPPAPNTATVEPGSTFAVCTTAPQPVITLQPIRQARSSGMSSRTLTERMLMHEHLLGECGQVQKLVQVLPAVPAQPLRDAGRELDFGRLADRHVARQTELAVSAEHREATDHMVAGFEVRHVLADRFDDAGRFVAEYRRHRRSDTRLR